MSMKPVLLGAAAVPAISVGANRAENAAEKVSESFHQLLESAGSLLSLGDGSESVSSNETAAMALDDPRAVMVRSLLVGDASSVPEGQLTIADMRSHADQLREDLEQRISEVLSAAGIQLDSTLRIAVSDLDGSLEVVGAHPQRAAIEAALNSDASLAADFQVLFSEQKFLEEYERSSLLAEAFVEQPWRAIAEFSGQGIARAGAEVEVARGVMGCG